MLVGFVAQVYKKAATEKVFPDIGKHLCHRLFRVKFF